MDALYPILLFVHILSASLWIGGGFVMEIMGLRLGRDPNRESMAQFFAVAHYVSPRVFMPAAMCTFVSGLILVFLGGAMWRDAWIVVALVGVVATMVLGATQIGPTVAKINTLLERSDDPLVLHALARRLNFVTRIDLLILVLVLLDMVLKPGL